MQGGTCPLRKAQKIRVFKTEPGRMQPGFSAPGNNVKPFVFYIRQTVTDLCRNREFCRIKQSQTTQQQDSVTLKPVVHKFSNNVGAISKLCARRATCSKFHTKDPQILGATVRSWVYVHGYLGSGDLFTPASNLTLSLSNGTTARGGPRPPSRVSSILPGLGRLLSNSSPVHSIPYPA
jgi:hypothetical protein